MDFLIKMDQKVSELGGLEIVTLNRSSYKTHPILGKRLLEQVQGFIAEHYMADDVLSQEEFKDEIQEPKNKNYTIDVAIDSNTKEVVAVVAHDVADVPKVITSTELRLGQNQYTSIYYATAKGGGKHNTSKKYEPALQMLIEHAMKSGQQYSASHDKTNVGLITIDSRHKRVLHDLAQKFGGGYSPVEVGVPTLRDDVVEQDYHKNFEELHKEKPVVIPSKPWSKGLFTRVMASDLDQSYNRFKPWEKGYRPLTDTPYFKDFAAAVKALPDGPIAFTPIF